MSERIFVADIGGTNARFATTIEGSIELENIRNYRVADFGTIFDAASAFLGSLDEKPKSACFAVAAPVGGEVIEFTNSPWRFRPNELQSALGLTHLSLVNDFFALASGVPHLHESFFTPIKSGLGDPDAPILVTGPGTGFGVALIIPIGERKRVVSTQGGHIAFAPQTEEERKIEKFIARKHGRVSVERVLSGDGIVDAYCALEHASTQRGELQLAADITNAAINSGNETAIKALSIFFTVLGRTVGDIVLATGARGGVVLGGGILPRVRELFLNSAFVDSFLDKGRMRDYVDVAPIKMIVKNDAALIGAAAVLKKAR